MLARIRLWLFRISGLCGSQTRCPRCVPWRGRCFPHVVCSWTHLCLAVASVYIESTSRSGDTLVKPSATKLNMPTTMRAEGMCCVLGPFLYEWMPCIKADSTLVCGVAESRYWERPLVMGASCQMACGTGERDNILFITLTNPSHGFVVERSMP